MPNKPPASPAWTSFWELIRAEARRLDALAKGSA